MVLIFIIHGESKKDLPIECDIKYFLDDKEISSEELTGKSGKVKIIIRYINKDEHIVSINGKDEKLYTPFVALCGTILKNDKHRNIEVSNGKIIDNGNKTIVIGMALPGLSDSLDLSKDEFKIPDTVEITMDSTDFELGNIATFVTPKVIEDTDLKIFDELDEVYNKVNLLESSSKEIEKGANTLKSASANYSEKSKEFNNAMKKVSNGVSDANKSYSKIDDGISTLYKNTATLRDGAKVVSEGTSAISTNLYTICDGIGDLQAGTKKLQKGEQDVIDGIDKILTLIPSGGTKNASITSEDLQELIDANTNLKNYLKNVDAPLLQEKLTELKDSGVDTTVEPYKTQLDTLNAQIANNTKLQGVVGKNITVYTEVKKLLASTSTDSMIALKKGLNDLKSGVELLQDGTDELLSGEKRLKTRL